MHRKEKLKSVKVKFIPLEKSPYKLLSKVRKRHHQETQKAKIALAWRIDYKPDPDGHIVLGKCKRTTELQREFADWDYVILLNKEAWEDPKFGKKRRYALLDHELCHVAPSFNRKGKQKRDERKRRLWRIRKHDLEEFEDVVERHGCYKKDLERFAEALLKHRRRK